VKRIFDFFENVLYSSRFDSEIYPKLDDFEVIDMILDVDSCTKPELCNISDNNCLSSRLQILRESPELAELMVDVEAYEEVETVGKGLLDRLTVPVIFPDG